MDTPRDIPNRIADQFGSVWRMIGLAVLTVVTIVVAQIGAMLLIDQIHRA